MIWFFFISNLFPVFYFPVLFVVIEKKVLDKNLFH